MEVPVGIHDAADDVVVAEAGVEVDELIVCCAVVDDVVVGAGVLVDGLVDVVVPFYLDSYASEAELYGLGTIGFESKIGMISLKVERQCSNQMTLGAVAYDEDHHIFGRLPWKYNPQQDASERNNSRNNDGHEPDTVGFLDPAS